MTIVTFIISEENENSNKIFNDSIVHFFVNDLQKLQKLLEYWKS